MSYYGTNFKMKGKESKLSKDNVLSQTKSICFISDISSFRLILIIRNVRFLQLVYSCISHLPMAYSLIY